MIDKIINDKKYQKLVIAQIKELLEYLVQSNTEFAVLPSLQGIEFNPKLPKDISENLAPYPLFVLANYTFESIKLKEDSLEFEAGFGVDNFGSVVTIPYYAIFQVILDSEVILYFNPLATEEEIFDELEQEKKSKNIFMSNPKNKDFFE